MAKLERKAGFILFAPRQDGKKVSWDILALPAKGYKGTYLDFPKGHVELGEKPFETAVREAHEELRNERGLELHSFGRLPSKTRWSNEKHNTEITWFVGLVLPAQEKKAQATIPLQVRYPWARNIEGYERGLKPGKGIDSKEANRFSSVKFVKLEQVNKKFYPKRAAAIREAFALMQKKGFAPNSLGSLQKPKVRLFPRYKTISGKRVMVYTSRRLK